MSRPKLLQLPETISKRTINPSPSSRKNTTSPSGETPREDMLDFKASSDVMVETGLLEKTAREPEASYVVIMTSPLTVSTV